MPDPDGPNSAEPFAREYAQMSEPELLRLAASYDSLVEAAQAALRAEFAHRNLDPPLIDDTGDPGEVDSEKLATVRRYRDLSAAIVGRTVLESAGLFCFLRDENFVRLNWFDSQLIGGLRLQVHPEDLAAAESLLNQPVPPEIPVEGAADYEQPHCPRCGSVDITFEGADRRLALTSLWAAAVPLPFGASSWHCETCDARWTGESGDEEKLKS
jgi:hypothetical protein